MRVRPKQETNGRSLLPFRWTFLVALLPANGGQLRNTEQAEEMMVEVCSCLARLPAAAAAARTREEKNYYLRVRSNYLDTNCEPNRAQDATRVD